MFRPTDDLKETFASYKRQVGRWLGVTSNGVPAIVPEFRHMANQVRYLVLGQSVTTLSGGEAQGIRIATELSKLQSSKHTVSSWTSRLRDCTWGHRAAAGELEPAGGCGPHGAVDRAPSGRDQDGGSRDRPGSGGRPRGRASGGHGDAGRDRGVQGVAHGTVSEGTHARVIGAEPTLASTAGALSHLTLENSLLSAVYACQNTL